MPDCYVIIDPNLKRKLTILGDNKKELETVYTAVLDCARAQEGSLDRFYYDEANDRAHVFITFPRGEKKVTAKVGKIIACLNKQGIPVGTKIRLGSTFTEKPGIRGGAVVSTAEQLKLQRRR